MTNRGALLLSDWIGSDSQKRRELSAQIRKSEQTIRNWSNGIHLPTVPHRHLLAGLCGVPFFSWDEPVAAERSAA